MFNPGEECPDCGAKLGAFTTCKSCGWKPTATKVSRSESVLPAYREMPDRREEFQACEHVPKGQQEPCPPCVEVVAELRRQFLEHGRRIARRLGAT